MRRNAAPLPALRRAGAVSRLQWNDGANDPENQVDLDSNRRRAGRRRARARRFWKRRARPARTIPTLCHLDGLDDVGACRLCMVEVGGSGRLAPACTTPVQEGLSVVIHSPRLAAYRRMIVELLLAERNHICAVCVSNGHCELQALATSLGVTSVRFPYRYPALPVDLSQERYVLDHNRCILCSRCVRVCAEVEGAHVWDIMGRGIHSRVV